MPGHEPIRYAADGVQIGPGVDRTLSQSLLRRHVSRSAPRELLRSQLGVLWACMGLHEPEVEHFHVVHLPSVPAGVHVGGFDVSVDQVVLVRFRQRVADLLQEVDGALGGDGAEARHERVQVVPVQELHDVVEGRVFGDSEIEQLNGVRRAHRRGGLRFAFEPLDHRLADTRVGPTHDGGIHELDGRRTRQHAVSGHPHLTHPTPTQEPGEAVAAHLSSA